MTSVLGLSSGFSINKKTGAITSTGSSSSSSNSSVSCCCPSTTIFLQTLTDKLYDMALSLKQQFADLANFRNNNMQKGEGAIIAAITVRATLTVKNEYPIYIQRYGPPINGIFDPIYLDLIRAEIAAGTTS